MLLLAAIKVKTFKKVYTQKEKVFLISLWPDQRPEPWMSYKLTV